MPNQKGFSKIAIIIIVLILIGGAYFVFSKKGGNKFKNIEIQNDQSNQSPSKDLSMSDWKTYRNEKYKFEIKYPPNFLFGEDFSEKDDEAEIVFKFGPSSYEVFGRDPNDIDPVSWYMLIINTHKLKKQETLDSYAKYKNTNSSSNVEKIEEVVVGGERAITFKNHYGGEDGSVDYVYYQTYMLHNDLLFNFVDESILWGRDGNIATNTYTQMLSTLKFTR